MKSIPVLLVDDDVDLCNSLKRLLSMDGFNVRAVHDGDSGVRHALDGQYELVIVDVMLPGGDGRKVLRRIRLTSQVPIIMLTARGDEADRIAGLERRRRRLFAQAVQSPRAGGAHARRYSAQERRGGTGDLADWDLAD